MTSLERYIRREGRLLSAADVDEICRALVRSRAAEARHIAKRLRAASESLLPSDGIQGVIQGQQVTAIAAQLEDRATKLGDVAANWVSDRYVSERDFLRVSDGEKA